MIYRISELENEEVDYLRFDRIKIQRKRMEHILEVIKDLTYKNKDLLKQKALLQHEHHQSLRYKHLYKELTAERKILIDNNIIANTEIERFKQITGHQQILINSLKEELYGVDYQASHKKQLFSYDFGPEEDSQSKYVEDYIVLKTQYQYLQKEYKNLYKLQYPEDSEGKERQSYKKMQNLFTLQREEEEDEKYNKILNKENSNSKAGIIYHINEKHDLQRNKIEGQNFDKTLEQTMSLSKLREKYDKMKKIKRDLVKLIKDLQAELAEYKENQSRNLAIIQLFKQKKGKVCECHIKKLQKKMGERALQSHS